MPYRTLALIALTSLLVLDIVSAIRVVWYRHQARGLSMQLYQRMTERDALQSEYGRLLLEQATYGDPHVVEERATRDLGMVPQPVLRLVRGQRVTPNWPLMIERPREAAPPPIPEGPPATRARPTHPDGDAIWPNREIIWPLFATASGAPCG